MLTYPTYKDSGISWLGKLPEHWDIVRLGSQFLERREKVSDKEFPPLSVTKKGILPQLDTAAKSDDGDNRKKVCIGDFVINSRSDRKGSSGISPYIGSVSLINIVLNPLNYDRNYIHNFFRSHVFKEEFYRVGHGIVADLWTTKYEDMRKIMIPLPPLPEQQQIAQYLDWKTAKINKFIKTKKKLIELLKEQKQNIINEAVTKGINPDVKMKDSGVDWIGDIPEHWLFKKIRHFCSCQNGISDSGDFFTDGYPFISYGDVYKNRVLPMHIKGKAKSNEKQQITYSVKKGDIFFTRTSEVLDEAGITSVCLETIPNAVFSGFLIRVRPNGKIINEIFSKYYFQATCVREYFTKEMNIVTRASLGQNILKNLPVLLPPHHEQIEIAKKLEHENKLINATISRTEKEIELIQEYQTRLFSDVVTGKIDVRSVQIPSIESIEAAIDIPEDEYSGEELFTEDID